jgi:transposase InsO family protein
LGCWGLIISMDDSETTSLEQIRAFLAGSCDVRFAGRLRVEVYAWTEGTLVRHHYNALSRPEKGLLRRYVVCMTGLSRAQVTRLITSYANSGRVTAVAYQRRKFATRYTKSDVDLLAYVDKSHGNLSGPATKRILEREYSEYGQTAYERVAGISVAQIYRFRNSAAYRKRNASYQPTRPTPIPIGERRKPRPQGRPGYLRIDTVHQGDRDGDKGVYHINAVDEVTQWEIVAATPQISEHWLIPLLEQLLQQFPFLILGFHSDNGSEFINYMVAKLLDKLLIEQTKSRAHRSGDNGLVECKNGAIIRKHMGFGHIGAQHAEAVDQFHRQYLNPYVNFHRPCAVAQIVEEANGKRRRVYRRWDTPFEIFSQTPQCATYLRPGVSMAELDRFAKAQSDTEAAIEMQHAKRKLLSDIAKVRA